MISRLSNAFAVSGYEDEVRDIILSSISNRKFDIKTDKMGNIFAEHHCGDDCPTVLLVSHMDEAGLIVTNITDDGYLNFDIVGDMDLTSLISKRVKSQEVNGIISLKAIHLTKKEERNKPVSIENLYIDIGARNKDEALAFVTEGDYFAIDTSFEHLGNNTLKGKALGRAISSKLAIDIINGLKLPKLNLICVFAVQKEVSQRGMKTALNSMNKADLAIVLDCADSSELSDAKTERGGGPVIDISSAIAEKVCGLGERHQYEHIDAKTNADIIKAYRADIPELLLCVPCNHKRTGVNTIAESDICDTEKLLQWILQEVQNGSLV